MCCFSCFDLRSGYIILEAEVVWDLRALLNQGVFLNLNWRPPLHNPITLGVRRPWLPVSSSLQAQHRLLQCSHFILSALLITGKPIKLRLPDTDGWGSQWESPGWRAQHLLPRFRVISDWMKSLEWAKLQNLSVTCPFWMEWFEHERWMNSSNMVL